MSDQGNLLQVVLVTKVHDIARHATVRHVRVPSRRAVIAQIHGIARKSRIATADGRGNGAKIALVAQQAMQKDQDRVFCWR